jgi:3-dehydroquinate synthase
MKPDVQEITLHTSGRLSRLLVGQSHDQLDRYLPEGKTVMITDDHLWDLYPALFKGKPTIRMGTGEKVKTLQTVEKIYRELIDLEADRSTFLVGVGGGIVCDVTGFVASTYMRGVSFGFVSTTLLSQVDASVGGKNGVNLGGYKNMVGVFNQPAFVICDCDMLSTLPTAERLSGLAEVVKHGLIGDAGLFAFLEENVAEARSLARTAALRMVSDSITLKSAVVTRDEREAGERRILNFGHTLGHALEKVCGISHGEAVSAGMMFAVHLSVARNLIPRTAADRIEALLADLGLPLRIDARPEELLDALRRDKKREEDRLFFVLLNRIGKAVVVPLMMDEVARELGIYYT